MEITNFYCAIEKIPFTPKCLKQCDNCNFAESLPKQETLEEAANKQWGNVHRTGVLGFIEGAKWQQKQDKNKYSEEEVDKLISIIQWYDDNSDVRPDPEIFMWFEQFKKK